MSKLQSLTMSPQLEHILKIARESESKVLDIFFDGHAYQIVYTGEYKKPDEFTAMKEKAEDRLRSIQEAALANALYGEKR